MRVRRRRIRRFLFSTSFLLLVPAVAFHPRSATARTLVVVSDLHLGVGRTADGEWHPFEDFRWHNEFALFLRELDEQSNSTVDLVLAGDTFELWQSVDADCPVLPEKGLGCTEAEVRARLNRAIDAHRDTLLALRRFARVGNGVVIVPGNHDAGLLLPSPRAALGAVLGPDIRIPETGDWMWDRRPVYVEHGHEIGADVNTMKGWPAPFLDSSKGRHLVRSWGEQFVQDVFNRYEAAYPIIDNISNHEAGITYVAAAEGLGGVSRGVGRFLRFFFFGTSLEQFLQGLGPGEVAPEWDLARTRERGPDLLVAMMPGDARYADAVRAAQREGRLQGAMDEFSDEELEMLCDYQHLRAQEAGDGSVATCVEAEGHLGAIVGSFRDPHRVMAEHLDRRRKELAEGSGATVGSMSSCMATPTRPSPSRDRSPGCSEGPGIPP